MASFNFHETKVPPLGKRYKIASFIPATSQDELFFVVDEIAEKLNADHVHTDGLINRKSIEAITGADVIIMDFSRNPPNLMYIAGTITGDYYNRKKEPFSIIPLTKDFFSMSMYIKAMNPITYEPTLDKKWCENLATRLEDRTRMVLNGYNPGSISKSCE